MSVAQTLVEQITAALAAAKEEEARLEERLDGARLAYAEAREERKKLDRTLRMLGGQSGGVTKEQARELVVATLQQTGPLAERELVAQVTEALEKNEASCKGLSLMLNLLRAEYADASGRWAIREGAKPEK